MTVSTEDSLVTHGFVLKRDRLLAVHRRHTTLGWRSVMLLKRCPALSPRLV